MGDDGLREPAAKAEACCGSERQVVQGGPQDSARHGMHCGPDTPFEYGQGRDPTAVHLGFNMAPQKEIWEGQVWGPGWPLDRTPFREHFWGRPLADV